MAGHGALRPERLQWLLTALSTSGADTDSFCLGVCELIGQAVPFEYGCLATTDPVTGMITGVTKTDPGDSADEEFANYEYAVDDINQFADIARRPIPVGVLELDTHGQPDHSVRFREFLRPRFSYGHEMRTVFRSGGRTWGALGVYRSTGSIGFTIEDADLMGAVSELIAIGLRTSLVNGALTLPSTTPGPAALIVGADNEIRSITAAAQQRIEELGGVRHGSLPMPLIAITAAARSTHRRPMLPRARIRTSAGQWLTLHAAALTSVRGRPPR